MESQITIDDILCQTKLNLNQIIPSAPEHISTASGTEGDFDLTK
jgi:hypothetical protein